MALVNLYNFHTSPKDLLLYDHREIILKTRTAEIADYVYNWLNNFYQDVATYDNDGSTKGILSQFMHAEEFELSSVYEGNDRVFTIEVQDITMGHILLDADAIIVSSDSGYWKKLKYTDIPAVDGRRAIPSVDNILNELFDNIAQNI